MPIDFTSTQDAREELRSSSQQRVGSRSAAKVLPKPDAVGVWRARQSYTGKWVQFTVTFGRRLRGEVHYEGRKWSVAAMVKGGWREWQAVNGASATEKLSDVGGKDASHRSEP